MTNERFFRMLSIALLGLLGLAVVPDSQATSTSAIAAAPVEDVTVLMNQVIPVEVQIVEEINEINAGRFNPGMTGDLRQISSDLASLNIDPNL